MSLPYCTSIPNWPRLESAGFLMPLVCEAVPAQGQAASVIDCLCMPPADIIEVPWENKEALSKEDSQP
jgi:hypothetical protein